MKLNIEEKRNIIEMLKDYVDFDTANIAMKIINDYLDEFDDIEFAKEVCGYYRYTWKLIDKYNGFREFKFAENSSLHGINKLINIRKNKEINKDKDVREKRNNI